MKTVLLSLCVAVFAVSVPAQSLTVTTVGTVPRLSQPTIPNCSTAPEPYYFAISGTISRPLLPGEDLRLVIRPTLLNGGPIYGCEWIKQCMQVVPDANGNITAIGQMGTNNQQRSWFTGAQARVALGIFPQGSPICMADPNLYALVLSNVTLINLDPSIPTLFDFQLPCRSASMDVQGTPTPGQSITYTLPAAGAVAFGLLDPYGFLLLGCQAYFNPVVPITIVSTDASGVLNLPIPLNPNLIGSNLCSQGVLVAAGPTLDLTQPTRVSIR